MYPRAWKGCEYGNSLWNMILTNDHPEEEYLHKPEVARHVAVVPGGGSLIHHPEVGD